MTQPLLSIIMPVYNVESYLSAAIESVLALDFKDWELLIIDDGSTDKSPKIAYEYCKNDHRISIFTKSNGGLSSARNYGLPFAKGKYIMFLDSDDTICNVDIPTYLNGDVCIFSYNNVQATKDNITLCISENRLSPGKYNFNQEKSDSSLVLSNMKFLNFAWNKIYCAKFIQDHSLIFTKGLRLIEDIDFNCRVYSRAKNISFIDVPLVNYFSRPVKTLSNIYHSNLKDLLIQRQNCYEHYCDIFNFSLQNKRKLLGSIALSDFRYFFRMLSASNKPDSEKKQLLKEMLKNKSLRKNLFFTKFEDLKSVLFFILIRHKLYHILKLIYLR